ncbi:cytochrome P450 [Sulfitobacter sp. LCG007]
MSIPPKPPGRQGEVSLWRLARMLRRDILSALPERLYRARMAEFRMPFLRSYLVNEPGLAQLVLRERPERFPRSSRVAAGLEPLLGASVFCTDGDRWKRQRRIVDKALDRGQIEASLPALQAASDAAVRRLLCREGEAVDIEAEASHAAADAIFRTMFSLPIEDALAREVFDAFRCYQRCQPVLRPLALLPLPGWVPRPDQRRARAAASRIRALIGGLIGTRLLEIDAGYAPDDLGTRMLSASHAAAGSADSASEMIDQVATFFLACHETSASALAWALYLMAEHPEWQARLVAEAAASSGVGLRSVGRLRIARAVFRETLRLYPPVPMMLREACHSETLRGRHVPRGSQIVISPRLLHRHERFWTDPDGFDPSRWLAQNVAATRCREGQDAYMPFGLGPRTCPGTGFAMVEGPLMLSAILGAVELQPLQGRRPMPVAHLTLRARDGIHLRLSRRRGLSAANMYQHPDSCSIKQPSGISAME